MYIYIYIYIACPRVRQPFTANTPSYDGAALTLRGMHNGAKSSGAGCGSGAESLLEEGEPQAGTPRSFI